MTADWQQTIESATTLRQELHRHPELGWEEERTARRIRETLDDLGVAWRPCAGTGTVAQLGPGDAERHVALRGDIDALPITERSGRPWRSETKGLMHACGHDGHTATLLATARWLAGHTDRLPTRVSLLFQPAEEGGHGAKGMIDDGALEGVDAIYGWHNWPAIPFGKIACPDDIVMCGNGTFRLTVHGRGGHASQPELCRDPVLAAGAIVVAMQQIVARRLPPQRAVVVSVASLEAPSGGATIIPDEAVIEGSYRVPDDDTRELVKTLIEEIAGHTAAAYGTRCEVELFPRYGATVNHADHAARVRELWEADAEAAGIDHDLLLPVMASEDFSYYLAEVPGAFALVGADDGDDHDAPCHNARYDFNDRLIPLVTRLYARLVGAPLPDSA